MQVMQLRLPFSNAYLLLDERPVLLDTGSPYDEARLLRHLAGYGVAPADLAAILHTHAHFDHAGSTAALAQRSRASISVHPADAQLLQTGQHNPLRPTGVTGGVIAPLLQRSTFVGTVPTLLLEDGMRLDAFGLRATIVATPGHTSGSITVLSDDGVALVGDLLMGGALGGALWPGWAGYHFFADDIVAVRRSIARVLKQAPHTWYVGHGGPLTLAAVRRFAASLG